MKPSELKISISVESYDEKTAENDRNCYVAEKRIVSKLSKISMPNFDSSKFKTRIKIVSKFHASPNFHASTKFHVKWSQKLISIFSDFLKVLELF